MPDKDNTITATVSQAGTGTVPTPADLAKSMANQSTSAVLNGDGKAAPWTAEDFDAEKAWKLVENLRGDVEKYKTRANETNTQVEELSAAIAELKTRAEQAETRASEAEAQLAATQKQSSKLRILRERGLPENLIGALTGDDEKTWTEMADMLLALKGSKDVGTVQPDPVQTSAVRAGSSVSPEDRALHNVLFPNHKM